MTPICFMDTESDGIHPDRKAWEIALIRRDENGERAMSFFVEINLSTADPFGLRVGRFHDRHPLGRWISGITEDPPEIDQADNSYLTVAEAVVAVARMTHGAHIVGAVPNFDTEIFDRLLRDHGLCPGWHYHLICAETLAVGFLAARDGITIELPWSSDDISTRMGLDVEKYDRHTALGDARWAMDLYDAVTSAERR